LLFGVLPARAAVRVSGATGVARAARGSTTGRRSRRLGDLLVGLEVAMAAVLVLGAGLLLRSAWKVASVDLGFDTEGMTVAWVGLPDAGGLSEEERLELYRSVGERLAGLPAVRGVAWTQASPLDAGPGAGLRIEGRAEVEDRPTLDTRWQVVSPDYFAVAGIPLLEGRTFGPSDGPASEPVAVISASLARDAFGGEDPLGQLVNTGLDGREGDDWRWVRVVGVVADTRNRGPTRVADPVMFRPMAQGGPGFRGGRLLAVLRTAEGAQAVPALLRRAVWEVDPDASVSGLTDARDLTEAYTGERRLILLLLGTFAALALGLGAVGTYGVTAFAVSRRTREVGVRLALGADQGGITSLVLRQGLEPVMMGLMAGVLAGA
ncbi:MAG TPA: ABC transporter permease, partial [Longimicrobiales bacterium]|nr:ABC transporter permease [Longimicrobiales bacterium]